MATLKDIRQSQEPKLLFNARRRKETEEIHLFKGTWSAEKRCTTASTSFCGKMKWNEGDKTLFQCEEETVARMECAKLGRTVCGTCVSTLYTTYQ